MNTLYTVRKGKAGAKRIFLVHGNMASTHWWTRAMAQLANEFDLLAADLRGYGQSPDGPPAITLADHANDLRDIVLQEEFAPFTLVGHSLGGAAAMQFAALYPGLLEGLVLLDSAPVDGMKNINYDIVQMMIENGPVMLTALKSTMVKPVDGAEWELFQRDCLRSAVSVMANARALDGADFSTAAVEFAKPVLVIHGEQDRVVALAEAQKTAATYPKARLEVVSGVGHNPQVEAVDDFVSLVRDFVRGV